MNREEEEEEEKREEKEEKVQEEEKKKENDSTLSQDTSDMPSILGMTKVLGMTGITDILLYNSLKTDQPAWHGWKYRQNCFPCNLLLS